MRKLILSFFLLIPFALSTQMVNNKRFIVELYLDEPRNPHRTKKLYCDNFILYKDKKETPWIKVINYESGYFCVDSFRAIRVKNLFPANDSAYWK